MKDGGDNAKEKAVTSTQDLTVQKGQLLLPVPLQVTDNNCPFVYSRGCIALGLRDPVSLRGPVGYTLDSFRVQVRTALDNPVRLH